MRGEDAEEQMTDLEMTRLCAEAMGGHISLYVDNVPRFISNDAHPLSNMAVAPIYDPLHDDAQAMALVKKFHAHIAFDSDFKVWSCCIYGCEIVRHYDLNFAICECVAKMQKAKDGR